VSLVRRPTRGPPTLVRNVVIMALIAGRDTAADALAFPPE